MKGRLYKQTAYLGMMLTIALILGYVDRMIPLGASVPGVKAGLSNTVVLVMLYRDGPKSALIINILRILLSGLLFGSGVSLLYGLAGGILSFIVMLICKRTTLSISGVSMAGGVFHNIGQLAIAAFLMTNYRLIFYLPVLLLSGAATGLLVGFISGLLLKALPYADLQK